MGEQAIQPPTQEELFIAALATANSFGPQHGPTNIGYHRYNVNEDRFSHGDVTPEVDTQMSDALIESLQDPHGGTTSKHTEFLVGNLFVQPVAIDHRGRRSLVFAFPVSVMIQRSPMT